MFLAFQNEFSKEMCYSSSCCDLFEKSEKKRSKKVKALD